MQVTSPTHVFFAPLLSSYMFLFCDCHSWVGYLLAEFYHIKLQIP